MFKHIFLQICQENENHSSWKFYSRSTYRPVLPVSISTSTLAEWDTFVSTEDEAGVTDASLYTGLVARATRACRVLTAGLRAGRAAWAVMTAWRALQSWGRRTLWKKMFAGCSVNNIHVCCIHQSLNKKEGRIYIGFFSSDVKLDVKLVFSYW